MLALLYQLWIKWEIYISVTEYFQYEHLSTPWIHIAPGPRIEEVVPVSVFVAVDGLQGGSSSQ